MKFFIPCCVLSLAALLATQNSMAQTSATSSAAPKNVSGNATSTDEDDMIPDIRESATYEYKCEMNDTLTIYTNADDNQHIAMRWKNRLYRLRRIETSTGANRFENKKTGLVWIGIPTKGMLLDSRHGQQLANECKTGGQ